jgi:capsular polysaccharide export protein
MSELVLFAASKDQLKYFTKLAQSLPEKISIYWYKKISIFTIFTPVPLLDINYQVGLLQTRKQNSSSGKTKSNLYWYFFKIMKKLEAIWLFKLYVGVLQKKDAHYVGVWNGKKFRQAIIVLAAKQTGKSVIYFERGPLPGYSVIDPKGVNFYSSLPRDKEFYLQYCCTEQMVMPLTSYDKPNSLPDNYVFVPFQVVEDSNIYLHSPWLRNMRHLYAEIENLSSKFTHLNFVIKQHPSCPEEYADLIEKSLQTKDKIRFVSEIDSTTLVANSQLIMTINSTVGMEAIMARKRLVVLGEAIYGFAGLAKPVSSRDELVKVITDLDSWQVDQELFNKYLCFVKNEYAVIGDAIYSRTPEHLQAAIAKLQLILAGKANQAIGLQ